MNSVVYQWDSEFWTKSIEDSENKPEQVFNKKSDKYFKIIPTQPDKRIPIKNQLELESEHSFKG